MSKAGRALWRTMNDSSEWEVDGYNALHKPTNTYWWIANGAWFFDGSNHRGTDNCLGFLERHWLYWRLVFKVLRSVRRRHKAEAQARVLKMMGVEL